MLYLLFNCVSVKTHFESNTTLFSCCSLFVVSQRSLPLPVTMRVILCTLLACVVLAHGAYADDYYSYLSLNLQWPATSGCSSGCNNIFTIHGMWPSVSSGTQPAFCGGTFNVDDIKSIMSRMEYAWPSYDGTNLSFWSHEYDKHGSCAKDSPGMDTEFGFFNTTLTIWQNLDIMRVLSNSGVYPSNSKTYKVGDIVDGVKDKLGYAPVIGCQDGSINTMALCFDRSLQLGPCPSSLSGCDESEYVKLPEADEANVRGNLRA